MNLTILLTGGTGQVGSDLRELLPALGTVVAPDRGDLDLSNPTSLRSFVRRVRPQLIVNAAAYTQVDQAENDPAAALAVNAEAPALLAEEAKRISAAIVHYSTDYVFDGLKSSPYVETDAPHPLSVYGRSKLAGEEAIGASGVPYLILRTAWVYSRRGRNFLLTVLRLSTQREELRIVSDQIGAPTWSRHIAEGTVRILQQLVARGITTDSFSTASGVYHMTASGETSWYEFARAILEECSRAPRTAPWLEAAMAGRPQIARLVRPISTEEYPTPAHRPGYSVLSNQRLREVFGVEFSHWRAQLKSAFESLE